MKHLRLFSLVLCFAMVLYSLIFLFSNVSAAEETPRQKCISTCKSNKPVCLNINADTRLCEAKFQECLESCKSLEDSLPSTSETTTQEEVEKIESSKPSGPN